MTMFGGPYLTEKRRHDNVWGALPDSKERGPNLTVNEREKSTAKERVPDLTVRRD